MTAITDKDLEQYLKELLEIMSGNKKDPAKSKEIQLGELAKKVGASSEMYRASPANAGETELIANILTSLQTASMINMCRTSNKNYKIAIAAAIAAILSALAAWAACLIAIKQIVIYCPNT
jgi:hypothetical protein